VLGDRSTEPAFLRHLHRGLRGKNKRRLAVLLASNAGEENLMVCHLDCWTSIRESFLPTRGGPKTLLFVPEHRKEKCGVPSL